MRQKLASRNVACRRAQAHVAQARFALRSITVLRAAVLLALPETPQDFVTRVSIANALNYPLYLNHYKSTYNN